MIKNIIVCLALFLSELSEEDLSKVSMSSNNVIHHDKGISIHEFWESVLRSNEKNIFLEVLRERIDSQVIDKTFAKKLLENLDSITKEDTIPAQAPTLRMADITILQNLLYSDRAGAPKKSEATFTKEDILNCGGTPFEPVVMSDKISDLTYGHFPDRSLSQSEHSQSRSIEKLFTALLIDPSARMKW